MRIRIADTFCEWEYILRNADTYSIADIMQVICDNTNVKIDNGYLINALGKDMSQEKEKKKSTVSYDFVEEYKKDSCGAINYRDYLEGRLESALREKEND